MKRILTGFFALVILLQLVLLQATPASAEEITISVKGMVCSFCAQGIKKTFLKIPGVTAVDAKLETKTVTVTTDAPGKLTDEEIKSKINDAGYEVTSIQRKA